MYAVMTAMTRALLDGTASTQQHYFKRIIFKKPLQFGNLKCTISAKGGIALSEYDKSVFASNLYRLMAERGMKAVDIAKLLNVSKSTVSSWLNAQKTPRMDKIESLAGHFGVAKSELIENGGAGLINGDPELTDYLNELQTRPEMRMFFSLAKDATKADVELAVKMLEALRNRHD